MCIEVAICPALLEICNRNVYDTILSSYCSREPTSIKSKKANRLNHNMFPLKKATGSNNSRTRYLRRTMSAEWTRLVWDWSFHAALYALITVGVRNMFASVPHLTQVFLPIAITEATCRSLRVQLRQLVALRHATI